MRVLEPKLKVGIPRAIKFNRRRLANFTVNLGMKCTHPCPYSVNRALLGMDPASRRFGKRAI